MKIKIKNENGEFKEAIIKGLKGDQGEKGEKGDNGDLVQQEAIDDIKSSLETWTQFKNNGGTVNGDIFLSSDSYGFKTVTSVGNSRSITVRVEGEDFIDYVNRTDVSSLDPYKNTTTLGREPYPFKDIFLNGVYKNANGYTKLPNGMIMQWGEVIVTFSNSSTSSPVTITYPIKFPSVCVNIQAMCVNDSTGAPKVNCSATKNSTLSSNLRCEAFVTSSLSYKINWIAIGY